MSTIRALALITTLLAAALAPRPAAAAGGEALPSAGPEERAASEYNRGIRHRDKAWELEEKAAAAADESERARLKEKARREYEKAARAFRQATEADPRMHQAFSSLGYALRRTGEYAAALEAYDRALELEPAYTEAIEYRAEAYLGLARLEEAKEAYLELFRGDRARADELLAAMSRWVAERGADPAGLEPATVAEFAAWVAERAEIAAQTAPPGGAAAADSW